MIFPSQEVMETLKKCDVSSVNKSSRLKSSLFWLRNGMTTAALVSSMNSVLDVSDLEMGDDSV